MPKVIDDVNAITIDPKWTSDSDIMATEWRCRCYWMTIGTQAHAIFAAALGLDPYNALPKYNSSATTTSDGFVMCGFTRENGEYHSGAFVDSVQEIKNKFNGLVLAAKLKPKERDKLRLLIGNWMGAAWV